MTELLTLIFSGIALLIIATDFLLGKRLAKKCVEWAKNKTKRKRVIMLGFGAIIFLLALFALFICGMYFGW